MKVEEPLSINIFSTNENIDKSTTGLNGQFVYSQLLIDCLLKLESNEADNNQLISLCKEQYKDNRNELKIVHEFEHDFSSDKGLVVVQP